MRFVWTINFTHYEQLLPFHKFKFKNCLVGELPPIKTLVISVAIAYNFQKQSNPTLSCLVHYRYLSTTCCKKKLLVKQLKLSSTKSFSSQPNCLMSGSFKTWINYYMSRLPKHFLGFNPKYILFFNSIYPAGIYLLKVNNGKIVQSYQ